MMDMAGSLDRHRRTLLILSTVAAFAILGSTMAKNPALPLLAQSIGAGDAQIGLISAISPIPGILVSSFAGAYSDRKGRAKVLTMSLLIFTTAPFLYLFVTEPWQLMGVRFYHGFATAIFMPVAMAAVADMYGPEMRGQKLALYSSATMVGRFIAPFMGGTMLYLANFSSVYLTCAVTGIIALVLSFAIPWEHDRPQSKRQGADRGSLTILREVVHDWKIMVTSAMEGVQYYAMGAFEAFLPIYSSSLGFNGFEIGVIMGIQVVSMLALKPVMGTLSDRRGRELSIVAGLLLGAIAIAGMPMVSNFYGLCFLSAIFGACVATATASTSALVSEVAGRSAHGSAIGVLSSVMDIGHSAGPLATGLIVAALSFEAGFLVASVLMVVGAIVFASTVWTDSRRRRDNAGSR